MTTESLLERHPLLSRLSADQLAWIANAGELESFKPGEEIVSDGSPSDALYLVLSGTIAVVKSGRNLATLTPGEFFGEMALVEPTPRSASCIASDESYVFRLPYFALQNLLEEDPTAFNGVLVTIVRVLSERLRRSNDLLASTGHLADWLAGSLV